MLPNPNPRGLSIPLWLLLPVVLALALASWISALDTATGDPSEALLLWGATVVAGALLAFKLLARATRA